MRFNMRDGIEDFDHIDVRFVEISEIFAMQQALFFGMISFD